MTFGTSNKLLSGVVLLAGLIPIFSPIAEASEPARVADLAWMSGSWAGPLGDQTLEENWTHPVGGSIASLIRFTGSGKTGLIELIVIEEEGGSLVFRVRQFSPGFIPRSVEPQTMLLTEIGDRRVRFEATEPGELKSLTYTRPAPDLFNIDVETGAGQTFQINLRDNHSGSVHKSN